MCYRYLRDPLFVFCLVAYLVNRFWLKSLFPQGFFQDYFNDLICLPFWVPIMLWGMRRLRWRTDDAPPRSFEILIPLVVWSVVFEVVLPNLGPFRHLTVSDPQDFLFYALGGLCAALFWKTWYRKGKRSAPLLKRPRSEPSAGTDSFSSTTAPLRNLPRAIERKSIPP